MMNEKFLRAITEVTDKLTGKVTRSLGEKQYPREKQYSDYTSDGSEETLEPGFVRGPDGQLYNTNLSSGRTGLELARIFQARDTALQNPNLTLEEWNEIWDGTAKKANELYNRPEDLARDAAIWWKNLESASERPSKKAPQKYSGEDPFYDPNNLTETGVDFSTKEQVIEEDGNYTGTPASPLRKKPKKQPTFKSIFKNN